VFFSLGGDGVEALRTEHDLDETVVTHVERLGVDCSEESLSISDLVESDEPAARERAFRNDGLRGRLVLSECTTDLNLTAFLGDIFHLECIATLEGVGEREQWVLRVLALHDTEALLGVVSEDVGEETDTGDSLDARVETTLDGLKSREVIERDASVLEFLVGDMSQVGNKVGVLAGNTVVDDTEDFLSDVLTDKAVATGSSSSLGFWSLRHCLE